MPYHLENYFTYVIKWPKAVFVFGSFGFTILDYSGNIVILDLTRAAVKRAEMKARIGCPTSVASSSTGTGSPLPGMSINFDHFRKHTIVFFTLSLFH